jgi:hypothetical protein
MFKNGLVGKMFGLESEEEAAEAAKDYSEQPRDCYCP